MIYDMKTGKLLISFNTYIRNSFHNTSTVAYEPTEQGGFTSDSRQNAPAVVAITAIASIIGGIEEGDTVDEIKDKLDQLKAGNTLVKVVLQPMSKQSASTGSQYYQYGSIYTSLVLKDVDYENSPDQLDLYANLTFQEIRMTDSTYTQSLTVANPENGPTSNAGQVQPTPSSDATLTSWLRSLVGG